MRPILYSLLTSVALTLPAAAQDTQTLADIRAELVQLNTVIQSLRGEMVASGQSGVQVSGDVLQRVDAIEAQMARLTARTEELGNRINAVVADGTNRVGDLNFRLTELEGGDLGALGETPVLGGDAIVPSVGAAVSAPEGVELAISEKADFDAAQSALTAGEYRSAADKFASFNEAYPGGPLAADAHFYQGEALRNLGDWNAAARAYLASFSGAQESPRAPEALYNLGLALNELGQQREACLMLQEVGTRFSGSEQVAAAQGSMQTIGCS